MHNNIVQVKENRGMENWKTVNGLFSVNTFSSECIFGIMFLMKQKLKP